MKHCGCCKPCPHDIANIRADIDYAIQKAIASTEGVMNYINMVKREREPVVDKGGEEVSKHTPGPWEYLTETTYAGDYPYGVGHKVKMGNELLTISCHGYGADEFFEEAAANARLIAAAPDLLEACKDALPLLWWMAKRYVGDNCTTWEKVKAAIEKAEGGA